MWNPRRLVVFNRFVRNQLDHVQAELVGEDIKVAQVIRTRERMVGVIAVVRVDKAAQRDRPEQSGQSGRRRGRGWRTGCGHDGLGRRSCGRRGCGSRGCRRGSSAALHGGDLRTKILHLLFQLLHVLEDRLIRRGSGPPLVLGAGGRYEHQACKNKHESLMQAMHRLVSPILPWCVQRMTVRFRCQHVDLSGPASARPTHIFYVLHQSFC